MGWVHPRWHRAAVQHHVGAHGLHARERRHSSRTGQPSLGGRPASDRRRRRPKPRWKPGRCCCIRVRSPTAAARTVPTTTAPASTSPIAWHGFAPKRTTICHAHQTSPKTSILACKNCWVTRWEITRWATSATRSPSTTKRTSWPPSSHLAAAPAATRSSSVDCLTPLRRQTITAGRFAPRARRRNDRCQDRWRPRHFWAASSLPTSPRRSCLW